MLVPFQDLRKPGDHVIGKLAILVCYKCHEEKVARHYIDQVGPFFLIECLSYGIVLESDFVEFMYAA